MADGKDKGKPAAVQNVVSLPKKEEAPVKKLRAIAFGGPFQALDGELRGHFNVIRHFDAETMELNPGETVFLMHEDSGKRICDAVVTEVHAGPAADLITRHQQDNHMGSDEGAIVEALTAEAPVLNDTKLTAVYLVRLA